MLFWFDFIWWVSESRRWGSAYQTIQIIELSRCGLEFTKNFYNGCCSGGRGGWVLSCDEALIHRDVLRKVVCWPKIRSKIAEPGFKKEGHCLREFDGRFLPIGEGCDLFAFDQWLAIKLDAYKRSWPVAHRANDAASFVDSGDGFLNDWTIWEVPHCAMAASKENGRIQICINLIQRMCVD